MRHFDGQILQLNLASAFGEYQKRKADLLLV